MTSRVTPEGYKEKLVQMNDIANLWSKHTSDHMHHVLSRANKSNLL